MSLEHEIEKLQQQFEITKDKRFKKAARGIEKIKNCLPEYSLSTEKPQNDAVEIFPVIHKTQENAILDQDIQVISEHEKRKTELMEELSPLIEFHSAEFARRVPQGKNRNIFKLRDKSSKIVQWSLQEGPDVRGDDFHINYLTSLMYEFDKKMGVNVPREVTMQLQSQHDRVGADSPKAIFVFENSQIVDVNLEWKYDHPNVISEIGKSSKMNGDIFQTTIKALEEEYALNHLSVMDKRSVFKPSHFIDQIKIASRIPSELNITYEKIETNLFSYKNNTSVSTYVYNSGKDKLAHFKTSTTHYESRDRTDLNPFYKDKVEKDEYIGIIKGIFGLIPTIQVVQGYQ